MDQILVHLSVPAISMELDAFIPKNIEVNDAVELAVEAAENYSHGYFKATGREVICVDRLEATLLPGMGVAQYRLENGDRLVLI